MKKTFDFGKIAFNGTRKINRVTVTAELSTRGGDPTFTMDSKTGQRIPTGKCTPVFVELSISGAIWNGRGTDHACGGQCLDIIRQYREQLSDPELFDTLFDMWEKYHLNGLHPGTPEQETAIDAWRAAGNRYTYDGACEMLKEKGLYTVPYTGKSVERFYNNEPYTYGHGWLVQDLPGAVLLKLEHMLSA